MPGGPRAKKIEWEYSDTVKKEGTREWLRITGKASGCKNVKMKYWLQNFGNRYKLFGGHRVTAYNVVEMRFIMKKSDYALTPANLAKLGVFDEFYDLYLEIYEISEITRAKQNFKFFRENDKEICNILNEFMRGFSYIFSDFRKWLHPNKFSMQFIRFVYFEGPYFNLVYKIISFQEFLIQLEESIAMLIWYKISCEKPKYSQENAYKMVNDHILAQVNEVKEIYDPKQNCAERYEVLVFKRISSISCVRQEHQIVTERYEVKLLYKTGTILLPVHRCLECGKIFIGEQSLRLYEKFYGQTILIRNYEEYKGYKWYEYARESKLHRTGYNADNRTWSEEERQHLLVALLEKEVLTFLEIKCDLENSIRQFENNDRFRLAVSKWKKDLFFINEYEKKRFNS